MHKKGKNILDRAKSTGKYLGCETAGQVRGLRPGCGWKAG